MSREAEAIANQSLAHAEREVERSDEHAVAEQGTREGGRYHIRGLAGKSGCALGWPKPRAAWLNQSRDGLLTSAALNVFAATEAYSFQPSGSSVPLLMRRVL
jgi:hypothetical protein